MLMDKQDNLKKIFKDNALKEVILQDLDRVLNKNEFSVQFQPVVNLSDASILGYEVFCRGPEDSMLKDPELLISTAMAANQSALLEITLLKKALETIHHQSFDGTWFLNIHQASVCDDRFNQYLTKKELTDLFHSSKKIIFEFKGDFLCCVENLKETVDIISRYGFGVALDNSSSGYKGINFIDDIRPDYIKLDMNIIRNIDKNQLKRSITDAFNNYCLTNNVKMIAEGIETNAELASLINLGIHYGQGFFLEKPGAVLKAINKDIINLIGDYQNKRISLYNKNINTLQVGEICHPGTCIPPQHSGKMVYDLFKEKPHLSGLPVTQDKKLLGLVMKNNFFTRLGTQYGYALYCNRPVTLVMQKDMLVVDYSTTLSEVSRQAMMRDEDKLYDYVLVTKDDEYSGIVTIKDLLLKSNELEVNYAKYLNPLTGLPGNVLIEQTLNEVLSATANYTVLYMDLDNFKVYNDVYGFESGDRMIKLTAKLICDEVYKFYGKDSFIGHIGGDDFIAIVKAHDTESLCDATIKGFEGLKKSLFSQEHLDKGYLLAKNRYGQEEKFVLTNISIAGITNKNARFNDIYELAQKASIVKKECKQIWSSCFIIK